MARRELTHLFKTEAEAVASLKKLREAFVHYPPMFPITDLKVEQRLIGKGDYRWIVAGTDGR